ncbi:DUF3417 domain-containing protein, partial [Fischerella thermalis]|uniref:DUF3417 domain-containing protein n=1 Tax=Fischerella thermalis TaxID=372787 RepID=UPI000CC67891
MTKNIAMTAALRLSEKLPLPLRRLADLAYNYWWSWTSDRIALFQTIDPQEWEHCGHNPVAILESATYERLTQLAEDPFYLKQISALAKEFDEYMTQKDTWVSRVAPQVSIAHPIAYFCAEFGIHESLPIYSGGLGILAGDHLKSSSDLGVPMVGVGLLYRQGYFRQRLNRSGWQEDYYVDNPFHRMPIELIKNEQGQPLTIEIQIRQRRGKK